MVYQPEEIVNRYVWEQFKTYAPNFYNTYAQTSGGSQIVPFFPAPVSNVPSWVIEQGLSHIIFDKFTRVRGAYKELYPIKTDQMRMTVAGGHLNSVVGGIENVGAPYGTTDRYAPTINMTSLIFKILDREDAAARDINEFAATLPGYLDSPDMFKYYFHTFNVYQSGFTETQQDVSDFMEYSPSRDLIIRYDYHSKQFNE